MQLASEDLSVLTVLAIQAAQQEDLYDRLVPLSKSIKTKSKELHIACKDALSAFKSQKSQGNTNLEESLQAATSVAMTVVAALESEHASSSNAQAVIQGKDVPADVREEVNQLTQDLCISWHLQRFGSQSALILRPLRQQQMLSLLSISLQTD